MSYKTNIENGFETFKEVALHPHFHMSVAFMGAATLMGVFNHGLKKPVLALEPVAAIYSHTEETSRHEETRRENETHPQHRGYGVAQRTPGRSGNI